MPPSPSVCVYVQGVCMCVCVHVQEICTCVCVHVQGMCMSVEVYVDSEPQGVSGERDYKLTAPHPAFYMCGKHFTTFVNELNSQRSSGFCPDIY